jgi:hypothetical protein
VSAYPQSQNPALSAAPNKFPKLDVMLPHAGGAFPGLIGRLDQGARVRPENKSCRTAIGA